MNPDRYNIRVYGILLNHKKEIMVCAENYKGKRMKKFPGGGHHLGESFLDCLKREFIEEFDLPVAIIKHLYTTDFLQLSAFNEKEQLISVYYLVEPIANNGYDNIKGVEALNHESIHWIPLDEIATYELTFPIDRKVAEMLPMLLA